MYTLRSKIQNYILSGILFFWIPTVMGQTDQNLPVVDIHVPQRLTLDRGLNTLDVQLQNNGTDTLKGKIRLGLPNGLDVVGVDSLSVLLLPGKKRFLSLRLQSQVLSALKESKLKVMFVNSMGEMLQAQEVYIDVPEKRSVVMQDVSQLQYLKQVGDSIYVKVRVVNNGTTDEAVKILFSSPDRLGNTHFKEEPVLLRSGADTLITARFAVEKYMLVRTQYTIRVTGIYKNSDVFGNLIILFSNITADRNYQQMFNNDGNQSVYSRNYIDLQADNMLGEQQTYYLRSEGEYRLSGARVRYSAYLTKMEGDGRPTLSNTFLEFSKGKNSYTAGNIQESMEASVYGRGLKFARQDTAKGQEISVGVVQRTSDLLGYYSDGDPGYTAFARLLVGEGKEDKHRYEGQFFVDKNKMDTTTSVLWSNSFDLFKQKYGDKMQLRAFVGAGLQKYDGDQPSSNDDVMPSVALGMRLDRRFSKWTFSSDNFYSSPYYTGNRRGALQFMERLNRSWGKMSGALGYTYYRYDPSYLSERFLTYSSTTSRWDLNLYTPITSFVSLSVTPSYNRDKGNFALTSGTSELATDSWRIMTTTSARTRNMQHTIYLTLEAGLVSVQGYTYDNFAFRSDISYNYKSLGLYSSFQKGAFQVADVLSSSLVGGSYGDRFSIGTRYGGHLFRAKLNWTANAMVNFNSGYGRSFGGNASVNYRLLKNTLISGIFQYNHNVGSSGYTYNFNNLRVGIRQNLKSQNLDRPSVKTGNLRVFCFYDRNNNGVYDEGDVVAPDYNFTIKDILFVTDKEGNATYKKLPYGKYILFFPRKGQYLGSSRDITITASNTEVRVPIQLGGIVRGTVAVDYNPGISMEVNLNLDLYSVLAKNEQGQTFGIRVDKNGNFESSLPAGAYSFYIDANSLPANVYTDQEAQMGDVETDHPVELKPFVMQVRTKKVEVKRFGR